MKMKNSNFLFVLRLPWQRREEQETSDNKSSFSSRTCMWTFVTLIAFSIVQITLFSNSITIPVSKAHRYSFTFFTNDDGSNKNKNTINPQQQQQQQQKQQQYETLWLITCETRAGTKDITTWQLFANAVKLKHERDEEERRRQNKDKGDNNLPTVEIKNICEGKEWHGFMTKFEYIAQFLDDLLLSVNDNNNINNINNNSNKEEKKSHLVLFSDSDVIFNVFGVSIGELLERYHYATTTTTTTTSTTSRRRPVLISSEPSCYHGGHCSQRILDELFPEASKDRSSCPRYINSGLYMGEATALRDMLRQILTVQDYSTKTTSTSTTTTNDNDIYDESSLSSSKNNNNNNNIISSSIIADTMRSLDMNLGDDQGCMLAWYGIHGRDQKLAVLDNRAMIFRNLMFGRVNATVRGPFTCGARNVQGRGCGQMSNIYRGAMDTNTSAIVTDEVPGCFPSMTFSTVVKEEEQQQQQKYVKTTLSTDNNNDNNNNNGSQQTRMYYENMPFIIHANGVTKAYNKWVIINVGQRIVENNLTV